MTKELEKIAGGCTLWARQTTGSAIFTEKPDKWFKIWFYLVNQANHKDKGKFHRGQCFTSYELIMIATGATKNQVKHCIEFLKAEGMLATEKATRGMFVTIVKYNTYQNLSNYESHTKSHQKATRKPHLKQECKNVKKYPPNSIELELSQLLLNLILERKPDFKKPDLQKWAVHIDRMIRIDKRNPEQIRAVIKWCQQDEGEGGKWKGWQNNILSTAKLREKFDKLEMGMGKTKTDEQLPPLEIGSDGLTPRDRLMAQQRQ